MFKQENRYPKWEKFYNKLNLIFYGIISVSFFPFAWAFLETQKKASFLQVQEDDYLWVKNIVLLGLMTGTLIATYWAHKRLLQRMKMQSLLEAKFQQYLPLKVMVYSFLEAGALLAFLGLYFTGEQFYSGIYVFILFLFSLRRPTYQIVVSELQVNKEDMEHWLNTD